MAKVPEPPVRQRLVEDPRFLGAIFQEVENAYQQCDYRPLLKQTEQEIAGDHAGYFARQTAPNDQPWAALKASTVKRKGHSTILVEEDKLRQSLVNVGGPNHISDVEERFLVFGTGDPKALFHQGGTGRMPARPPVGLREQRVDAIANDVADFLVGRLKG